MTKEEIIEKIYDDRVDGIYPGEDKPRWIDVEELTTQKYFIVYSDDGGDSFVQFAKDEESFKQLMHRVIILGDTKCDFDTSVRLIVKDGKPYIPTIQ